MKEAVSSLAVVSLLALAGALVAETERGPEPLELYAQIHAALADDRAEGVAATADRLAESVRVAARTTAEPAAYEALAAAADDMQGEDLGALREQFAAVSKAFAAFVNAGGARDAQLYYCPMADAYWLQRSADAELENPYYGKSMLRCGSKVDRIEG